MEPVAAVGHIEHGRSADDPSVFVDDDNAVGVVAKESVFGSDRVTASVNAGADVAKACPIPFSKPPNLEIHGSSMSDVECRVWTCMDHPEPVT